MIEIENPYEQAGEFKITILESNNRFGVIKNPYNKNATVTSSSIDEATAAKQSTSSLNNESQLKQPSKSTVETTNNNNSKFSFKSNSRTKTNKSPTTVKKVKINNTQTEKHNGKTYTFLIFRITSTKPFFFIKKLF